MVNAKINGNCESVGVEEIREAKINGNSESVGVEEIRDAINGTTWPIILARGESEKVVAGLNGEGSPYKTELDRSYENKIKC